MAEELVEVKMDHEELEAKLSRGDTKLKKMAEKVGEMERLETTLREVRAYNDKLMKDMERLKEMETEFLLSRK